MKKQSRIKDCFVINFQAASAKKETLLREISKTFAQTLHLSLTSEEFDCLIKILKSERNSF